MPLTHLEYLGAGVGLGTLVFGAYQYWRAQRWKRSEFAAKLLDRLSTNPDLALCCKMLDWSSKPLIVPEHRRLDPERRTLDFNVAVLERAMVPDSQRDRFSYDEALCRDLFDEFFTYLEEVEHFVSRKLISVRDVEPLAYWLRAIAEPRFSPRPIFQDFLEAYDYSGVTSLMRRFSVRFRRPVS